MAREDIANELTTEELAHLVEWAEARAYVDLLRAAPKDWGFRAEETDLATLLIAPGLDIPLFNRAIGFGLRSPVSDVGVKSIVDAYKASKIRNFALQLSPAAHPPDFRSRLEELGLSIRDNWAKVYRPAEPAQESMNHLRVEQIGNDLAATFASVACAAFHMPDSLLPWLEATVGRPGWHHYLALDGEAAIAAGAMFVLDNVGWLGIAGTLPSHRRNGAQGALMTKRINDGIDLGCRWLVTETGEDLPDRPNPSFHNMMRLGFKLAYQRPNYMRRH